MLELGKGNMLGFLDEIYRRLGEAAVSRGGEIVKYLGDGFLAVFPTAASAPDACRRAAEAGFAMREAYSALVRERGITTETEMEIGLSLGLCERGVIGHASLRTREVFGDVVNLAAAIGHHRGIAATAPVREAIGDALVATRLADGRLKWTDEPIELWELSPRS